jgi:hypothetical protein
MLPMGPLAGRLKQYRCRRSQRHCEGVSRDHRRFLIPTPVILGAALTNEHARTRLLGLDLQEREQVGIDLVRINGAHTV